jgi:hypothetical protein
MSAATVPVTIHQIVSQGLYVALRVPSVPAPIRRPAANTNEPHELSDSEVLEKLRKTFGRLDRWRTVIASRSEPRQRTRERRSFWPWAPPTCLCIASLGSAP